jgi:hypothetical protein
MMELVVVIALSTIIVGMVFTTWKFVETHIGRQKRISLFLTQADRSTQRVVTEIKRASIIIEWDRTSIRFVADNRNDTVTYRFTGEELMRNDTALTPGLPGMRLMNFTIDNNSDVDLAGGEYALLDITFGYEDGRGTASTSACTVYVRCPSESNVIGSGIGRGWNW